jgi:ketosteroid isomerase-like protein
MKTLLCLTLLFAFVSPGLSQQAGTDAPLEAMVATERAFAAMSEAKGTRPSFMAFIADDGILFRPKAVKGKQWMIDHPQQPSEKRDLLVWEPRFAEVSLAGDMGYTFGPWQYKKGIDDARPFAWGHFVTVWEKQADDSWKFAVDLGISHPQPPTGAVSLEQSHNAKKRTNFPVEKTEAERAALLSTERKFSEDSASHGAQEAFRSYAAPDVMVFREGKFPFKGKLAAAEAISLTPGLWTWQPEGWDVSRSGDLGYSYGTYWLKSSDASAKPETGNYFRIWKKRNGVWKVVVDLANPIPEKQT